jgi:ectoine hydroxylase-related dioxygenase (phytanoyl-CoA dioxygenase family)
VAEILTGNGIGYSITQGLVSENTVNSIVSKIPSLYPVRASSSNMQYAEGDSVKNLPDISVWWSQSLMDWPEVQQIHRSILPLVEEFLPDPVWYASDMVTIEPNTNWVNPHVDTPHRFKQWNRNPDTLGIQCIVALQDIGRTNGATGIVPGSQEFNWDIDKCYAGEYNSYFRAHYIQPTLAKGGVIMYSSRLLHSSMPNFSDKPRSALLLNYLRRDIVEEVRNVDNIWRSQDDN